ncbi:MAG: AAA family ATPase, partial [Bacteroidales bacterium]|nr:AAA family ATPase [Bacteroidales bacterium]
MNIAIASGKGGTGKTTLSVNLAALFAEERKIVLADLDVEEPNSGLFL